MGLCAGARCRGGGAAEVSFRSLCYVEDCNGIVWLRRLADVNGNILCTPSKSAERADMYFDNRDRLFLDPSGPSDVGAVGIWDWYAYPDKRRPGMDRVESHYMEECSPMRVVVLPSEVSSLEEIVERLRNGAVDTPPYFCDTLFCCETEANQLSGVLCRADEFKIKTNVPQFVKMCTRFPAIPSVRMISTAHTTSSCASCASFR